MKLLKKILVSILIVSVPVHWQIVTVYQTLWICLYWYFMFSIVLVMIWGTDYLNDKLDKDIQKTKADVKKESLEIDETLYTFTEVLKEYYAVNPNAQIGIETSTVLKYMEEDPARWNEAAQRVSYKRAVKAGLLK
jgi:hypothetical protein